MSAASTNDVSDTEMTDDELRHGCKRVRLKVVVDNCVKRWFKEYLFAAEQGDHEMQLLVAAMFNSGYGVERDPAKGKFWLAKARASLQNQEDQRT